MRIKLVSLINTKNIMKKLTLFYFLLTSFSTSIFSQQFNIDSTTIQVDTLTENVNIPWDITWGPDHMIWMTDGPHIKRMHPVTGETKTIWTSPRSLNGRLLGNGLGMTFHPDFFNTPQVFIALDTGFYYRSNSVVNIYRYDYSFTEDSLYNETLILTYNTSGEHCGARMLTTQDGKIMVTTPDYWYHLPKNSLQGRTLRFNPDGSIPNDNPFGNYTWTVGHRNAQGIVQAPNGKIYASEHGQWTRGQDELNLIVRSQDYGWPAYDGTECSFIAKDSCNSPTFQYTDPISNGRYTPSGIDYYEHTSIPEFSNSIVQGNLNFGGVKVFNLNATGDQVSNTISLFPNSFGRIRDICVSPSGKVYMITNDRLGFDVQNGVIISDAVIRVFGNINYDYCTPTSSVAHHQLCSGESINIANKLYSGTQNVIETLINSSGCDSLVIHVIEEKNEINTTILSQGNSLKSIEKNATYQWLNCQNNTAIVNAKDSVFIADNSGSYAVEITKNNCIDTSACQQISILGSYDESNENSLFYPNPANESIIITADSEPMLIEIRNMLGQRILSKTRTKEIDITSISPGTYIIVLEFENRTYNKQFIKK